MGLRENMRNEPVTELALREVIAVAPDSTVREAIEKMRAKRLGCVVVTRDDGAPIGLFTEREVLNLLTQSPASVDDPVQAHLAPDYARVSQTDPIADVVEAMLKKPRRFVCVADPDGRLVAITGQKGVLEYIADHFPRHVLTQSPGAKTPDEREGA